MKIEGKQIGHVKYSELSAKQQERFNFQKASAILADYGFAALKLDDDWNGADFLAHHINGEITLKIQLKGRISFAKKYSGKNIYIMFKDKLYWYLYPHDKVFEQVSAVTNIKNTESWIKNGGYNMGKMSDKIAKIVEAYRLQPQLD
jgi:hypothetical protein